MTRGTETRREEREYDEEREPKGKVKAGSRGQEMKCVFPIIQAGRSKEGEESV